jgi:4-hydroxy-tetrahydrodipicolinate reductase
LIITIVENAHPVIGGNVKVGLFGFGKTGRAVATVLISEKITKLQWVAARHKEEQFSSATESLGLDSVDSAKFVDTGSIDIGKLLDKNPVDVIVDFSSESGLDYYGEEAAKRGISIVTAVSQYDSKKQATLKRLAQRTRVLWSPNITLGINFMFMASKALKQAAPDSDVQISEEHFREKAEVSGTAVRLAKLMGQEVESINSVRAGGIVGVHEVLFGYQNETLRLRHESISREAFGNGAYFATTNLPHWPIGYYNMQDLIQPYFSNQPTDTGSVRRATPGFRGKLARTLRILARKID